jgi:hypothetical protein
LVALTDADGPGIIFGASVAEFEQLLEHDRDLLPVRRGERVELEWVLADRELCVVRRSSDRAVDGGKLAAAWLVPDPDSRRGILDAVGHLRFLSVPSPRAN